MISVRLRQSRLCDVPVGLMSEIDAAKFDDLVADWLPYRGRVLRKLDTQMDLFGYLWRVVADHERRARDEAPKAKARPRAYLITRADLARATGISERTIKNFCSLDKTSSHTSKDKIVALSVAFRLPVDYTAAFLATCGHALGTTGRDGVIRDFIDKQRGDVFDLNLLLEKRGMPVLATASD